MDVARAPAPTEAAEITAQAFMSAMSVGNFELASKYGTPEAIDSAYDQLLEPGACLLDRCEESESVSAAATGGEIYCWFTGEYSLFDLALHDTSLGAGDTPNYTVVGAYSGMH